MPQKVEVLDPGDTTYLIGETVPRLRVWRGASPSTPLGLRPRPHTSGCRLALFERRDVITDGMAECSVWFAAVSCLLFGVLIIFWVLYRSEQRRQIDQHRRWSGEQLVAPVHQTPRSP